MSVCSLLRKYETIVLDFFEVVDQGPDESLLPEDLLATESVPSQSHFRYFIYLFNTKTINNVYDL
jgi:hypothetical protein